MAIESYQDQLERVQAAIAAIESGTQSYTMGGRTMSRGNLADLYKRETFLRKRVNRQKRGGIRVRRPSFIQ